MDAVIKSSFWSDARTEDLSPAEKLAVLWLITNPSRDLCGFTSVSAKRFRFETGLDPAELEGACKGLGGSIEIISPGVYFMVHFLRHQFGKGGKLSLGNKVIFSAARYADRLPTGLRSPFFEAYPELLELVQKTSQNSKKNTSSIPLARGIEGGSIPLARGIEGGSIPLTVKREGVRVRVRVGEGEGERAGEEEEGCGEKLDLVGIVSAYPRREGVAEALGHLARSVTKGADPGAILSGTRAIAGVIGQLPSSHLNAFVVSAATFFKNERWRDDPQTWLRAGAAKSGAAASSLNLGGRKVGSMTRVNS